MLTIKKNLFYIIDNLKLKYNVNKDIKVLICVKLYSQDLTCSICFEEDFMWVNLFMNFFIIPSSFEDNLTLKVLRSSL